MDEDNFAVALRVGDSTRTVGYAGTAHVSGHDMIWTAEITSDGIGINPSPVEPAKWDGEEWHFDNGETIPADALEALMQGMGRTLQAITNGAAAAAEKAYGEALTAAFGEVPTQRVMFL